MNNLLLAIKHENVSNDNKIMEAVKELSLSPENKKEFVTFLKDNKMKIRSKWDSKQNLEALLKENGLSTEYVNFITEMKKYFITPTQGILTFLVDENGRTVDLGRKNASLIDKKKTYEKVKALYEYVTGYLDEEQKVPRFNRLTLDGQGKFGTVAGAILNDKEAKIDDYNLEPLRQGIEFAKKHGMDVRINTLCYFKDFPDRLVGKDKKTFSIALEKYGKIIAQEFGDSGVLTTIDMFNEFVDYYEPFSERTNAWHSKLNIEELCKVALSIKREMPNVDFGYNDWNFENHQKRKEIIKVIRKIQKFEEDNNCKGKILGHIGMQFHTDINTSAEKIKKSIEEMKQFGVPIDVTELDISKGLEWFDYDNATKEELMAVQKYEQKLQNEIMSVLSEYVNSGVVRGITAWSLTDEICTEFCVGKEASINGYDGNKFFGKDMEEIILTKEEEESLRANKERNRHALKEVLDKSPMQNFSYHIHTERCGHGAKDTGDEEFVKHAIKGGMEIIAFTDHVPLPDGINVEPRSRMDIAETDSYLKSIQYLNQTYNGIIKIESGFEFEYSNRDLERLKDLKLKTDKMVLGQHFVLDDNGIEYKIERKDGKQINEDVLELYKTSIISAMDNNIPDIVAHPDLFMQCRDTFGEKEEEVARDICRKAIEKGVTLEVNLGKIASKDDSKDDIEELKKNIPYPSKDFWKIVAEETEKARGNGYDLNVIFGKDAHYPEQLSNKRDYEIAIKIIGIEVLEKLHFVKSDLKTYNQELIEKLRSQKKKKSIKELADETLSEQNDTLLLDSIIRQEEIVAKEKNQTKKIL